MNFNIGGPSNFNMESSSSSSSSSSSDSDEFSAMEEQIIQQIIRNNNMIAEICATQLNNQPTRGGSIPGHVVIIRDREAADHNLFNDYFFENHGTMKICSVAGFECLDLYFFGSLKQSEIMIAIFIKDVMVLVDLVCQPCKK